MPIPYSSYPTYHPLRVHRRTVLPFFYPKLNCFRWSQHVLNLLAVVQAYTDEDGAPATLPEMGNAGEESKLKVLLGLLRK
jgi:hypothetical protein